MSSQYDQDLDQKYLDIINKNRIAHRKIRNSSELSISDNKSIPTPKNSTAQFKGSQSKNSYPNVKQSPQLQQLIIQNQTLASQNNSFQSYIKQLTTYINQSSKKYSQNIQKYGISFKQLYIKYTNLQQESSQQILLLKNELLAEREKVYNTQTELQKYIKKNKSLYEQIQQQKHQRQLNRNQIKQLLQTEQNNKKVWNGILEQNESKMKQIKINNQQLNHRCRTHTLKIQQLQQQIIKLQKELRSRQDLPQKMINKEKQILSNNINLRNQKNKLEDLMKQFDIVKLQLVRSEKEREQLRVKNSKLSGDFQNYFRVKNKEYEDEWSDKQFKYQLQITQLKQLLEKKNIQIKQVINQGNEMKQQIQDKQKQISALNKRVKNQSTEKQSYLQEFRILKNNYQQVINNLENTVEELQQKLWNLGNKNKELEHEIDKFREVTYQLEYINNQNQKKQGTDYLKQEVEIYGLGDPVRLLRGEEDNRQAQRVLESKVKNWKQQSKQKDKDREKGKDSLIDGRKNNSDDPWANLMDKINSM